MRWVHEAQDFYTLSQSWTSFPNVQNKSRAPLTIIPLRNTIIPDGSVKLKPATHSEFRAQHNTADWTWLTEENAISPVKKVVSHEWGWKVGCTGSWVRWVRMWVRNWVRVKSKLRALAGGWGSGGGWGGGGSWVEAVGQPCPGVAWLLARPTTTTRVGNRFSLPTL